MAKYKNIETGLFIELPDDWTSVPGHPYIPIADEPSALAEQVGGSHYKDFVIQPIEFIQKNGLSFIEGSVLKYICRWRNKNGIEDLKKARHYLDMLIEMEEKK